MADIVTLGELLIDLVSTQKNVTLFDAPAFEPKPGGAPANVAVGVRRLGGSSAFIGKLGRDDFGQGLRRLMQQEGVDTRNLCEDPRLPTTIAVVSLSDRGEPHFAIYSSASINLQPSDLDADLIGSARIFHSGSVALANEPSGSAAREAIRIAKANHVICSLDINWRPAVWPDPQRGTEAIQSVLPFIDVLKMNADELRLLTGEADVSVGLKRLEVPAQLVVITLSEKGCLYRFDGKLYEQSVTPVETVVDATGAGDAFMAALLAGLRFPLEANALPRLMRRACQAGAITTIKRGAIPALPYADDLKAFEL